MKRIIWFCLVFMLILLTSCSNNDNHKNIVVDSEINLSWNYTWGSYNWNYIWWAAMNFAWNELKENILKEDVILDTQDEKALELNEKLNNSIITKDILDEESYYIKSGYWQETVNIINKESKEKFPEKSFDDLNINLEDNDIISYAYFFKAVEYKEPFEEEIVDFKWEWYKWFKADNVKQRSNVKILNYDSDDKFIVKLNLKDNSDELILVKWYDMGLPEEAIEEINKYDNDNLKSLVYNDTYHDFFRVPNIKLDYHRDYEVMIEKRLLNKVLVEQCRKDYLDDNCYKISEMFENIKFDMDNKWAKVENEAVVTLSIDSAIIDVKKPEYIVREFYLDDDYWIIMKRKDNNIPYFILGVINWEIMEKE